MILNKIKPSFILKDYIDSFYFQENNNSSFENYIIPETSLNLIFNADGNQEVIKNNKKSNLATSLVGGWFKEPVKMTISGNCDIIQIKFKAGKLYPFIGVPLNEIINQDIDIYHLLGEKGKYLKEIIYSTKSKHEKIFSIENVLIDNIINLKQVDPVIKKAKELIDLSNGIISIKNLSNDINISERQFERKFNIELGMSPKTYSNLVRFNKIKTLFNNTKFPDFASIAVETGFYDQAHFIKDFSKYSGMTPQQFLNKIN